MTTEMFERGRAIRSELAGKEYVDRALEESDGFIRPMQEFVTEYCWGAVWSRPGLDRRSRSILNLGMMAAANRPEELAGHIRIGLRNGLTKDEIQECFLQASIYLGMPAGLVCFNIAKGIFDELGI